MKDLEKIRTQGTGVTASIDQYGFVYIGEQRFEPVEKRLNAEHALTALEHKLEVAIEAIEKYRVAMDKLYNHNEAVRHAVIEHFGLHHPFLQDDAKSLTIKGAKSNG